MTPLLPAPSDTHENTKAEDTKPAREHKLAKPRSNKRKAALGLAAVSALLAIFVAALAVPHINEGTGDRTYRPTAFEAVEHHYEFGIGSLTVDLRNVDFPAGTHRISVDHGIGSARVFLPADVAYDVSADLDAGEINVFGDTEDGFNNDLTAQASADGNTTAVVIVDLEVDIGYGSVRHG